MRLPVPINYKDNVYLEVEVEAPGAGLIANTINTIDRSGDSYSGLHTWITGCIKSIKSDDGKEITDKSQIRSMVRQMPYKSAEFVALKTILMINDDDEIEGVYNCPRCDNQTVAERIMQDGEEISNTLDHVEDLEINFTENGTVNFEHIFSNPIEIKSGQPGKEGKLNIEEIQSIVFHYPTLGDCISAYLKCGSNDKARLQFGIYVESIEKVNGEPKDKRWKNSYGMKAFDNIKNLKKDLLEIFRKGNEYGLDPNVKKNCNKCGKRWEEPVNSMNFFGSALRSIT